MKGILNYYYNINPEQLNEENGIYHFFFNEEKYIFYPFNYSDKEFNNIKNIILILDKLNINTHVIIENNQNNPITDVDGNNYILLKDNKAEDEYTIIEINDMNNKTVDKFFDSKLDWYNLWIKKVDYIENSIMEIKLDNIIKKTIDYYLGLAENAIQYVYNTNIKYNFIKKNYTLSHKRIYYPNYLMNYLNPLSFIIDLDVRDIAEYLKALFFYGGDALNELKIYLSISSLNVYSINMLFARLLYPTYYFDLYEEWLNNKARAEDFFKVVKEKDKYEDFIKKAYFELSKYAELEKIDWIIY